MRWLDYWCGIPLCFLLSGVAYFQKIIFSRQRAAPAVRKILVIKLSELGAIVLAYPLLKRLRKDYPSADVFFLTFSRNKFVFSLLGGIVKQDNVMTISDSSLSAFALDIVRTLQRIRRERIDIVLDLEFFSRCTAALSFCAGSRMRVGFHHYTYEGLYRGNLFTHRIQYVPGQHMAKTFLSFALALKQSTKRSPEMPEGFDEREVMLPRYQATQDSITDMNSRLLAMGIGQGSRLLLMHCGEGMLPLREWPLDYFKRLIQLLLADPLLVIVIVGLQGAEKKAQQLLSAVSQSRCKSLVGQTDLEALMALFHRADALVTNDCGLAHLAALTELSTLVMFGPETPDVFGPLGEHTTVFFTHWPCSPCLSVLNNRMSACKDNACLKAIQPEEVYQTIQAKIRGNAGKRNNGVLLRAGQ
ncbi:MAG: glycosyltransferase family 9 protein [Candidatus Omnitrophica bacterium]|nr:glycosyltransferase family 9 protein [Candidatus Omnitrophota bacterium]